MRAPVRGASYAPLGQKLHLSPVFRFLGPPLPAWVHPEPDPANLKLLSGIPDDQKLHSSVEPMVKHG